MIDMALWPSSAGLVSPFSQGRVEASNDESLYISTGSAQQWTTVPWEEIFAEIYRSKTLPAAVLAGLSANMQPKCASKAVSLSMPPIPSPTTPNAAGPEAVVGCQQAIPAIANTRTIQLFASVGTGAVSSMAYSNVSTPTIIGSHYPSVVVAPSDTIDRLILSERPYNSEQREYVWSHASLELYEADSQEGRLALQEPATIRMIYPPGTMILARDADGYEASPAWTARRADMKPSNEWIKAQVCHHMCEKYRAGTSRLNRAATIRSHFQKCVWLHKHHPLKIHSSLHLQIHELRKNGLVPHKARSRTLHFGYLDAVGGLPRAENQPAPASSSVQAASSPLWSPLSSTNSQHNSPRLADSQDGCNNLDHRVTTHPQGWTTKKGKSTHADDDDVET